MTMSMALGDGLLQEVWFSDSSKDEGSPSGQGLAYQSCRGHKKWRVGRKTSEPSSAVVCDIHIYTQMENEHDYLENFIRFLQYHSLFLLFKYIFTVQTLCYIVSCFYNI